MIKEKLENLIKRALEDFGVENPKVELEHPAEISHGDFSSNVSLLYAKDLGKNPRELAEKIVSILRRTQGDFDFLQKIEIAGPGFINFYLSKDFFISSTKEILKEKKDFGLNKNLVGQKIIIEYTQPNPFKVFHIGHLVNNIVGEAVSRLIEAEGPKLKRATYHGDVGLHVAKVVWALINQQPLQPTTSTTSSQQLTIEILGKAYAEGDRAYEADEAARKEIVEINKKIYEQSDPEINEIYKKGLELSLSHFKKIYTRLGSKFDASFFESEAGEVGRKLVAKFLAEGMFEKSENAIILSGEKSGLHTRVFINSEGLPTYEAKDLGLIELKRKFFKFDRSITVTDVEQSEYYKVVVKASEFVFPKLKGKIEHLSHGRLRLSEGRMSSRTGNIIGGEELLNQLHNLALQKMAEREIENKEDVADKVAVAALKYSILKQAPGKNIVFDFEKSLSFEGDSGPYLQYSAVRAKSVLEKAGQEKIKPSANSESTEINNVERLLYKFPEVVEEAAKEFAPQKLATYLIELAGEFNGFYAKEKIVDKTDKNSPYKIALTEAVFITLQNGLWLLGIEVPEKM